jgi:hypothetical protein
VKKRATKKKAAKNKTAKKKVKLQRPGPKRRRSRLK